MAEGHSGHEGAVFQPTEALLEELRASADPARAADLTTASALVFPEEATKLQLSTLELDPATPFDSQDWQDRFWDGKFGRWYCGGAAQAVEFFARELGAVAAAQEEVEWLGQRKAAVEASLLTRNTALCNMREAGTAEWADEEENARLALAAPPLSLPPNLASAHGAESLLRVAPGGAGGAGELGERQPRPQFRRQRHRHGFVLVQQVGG